MIDIPSLLHTAGISLGEMQQTMWETARRKDGPHHLLLLSPTGSGKTLAYLLPMLELIRTDIPAVQAIVVLPTRELALQGEEMLRRLKTNVKSCCLYGGRPTMEEHRRLNEIRPQVIFATPGRLGDHLDKDNFNAFGVRILVIDEYDKCLEMGFREEVMHIVHALNRVERIWLTSATATEEADPLLEEIGRKGQRFERLDYLNHEASETGQRVEVMQVISPERDKLDTLGRLLSHLSGAPAIVFVSHRESANRIGDYLRDKRFAMQVYHGGMEQDKRERALLKFRNGSANVLVATDIAARGLDIPEVQAIIHYHLPMDAAAYTHRIGRATRWEGTGSTYIIIGPQETMPEFLASEEIKPLNVDTQPISPTPAQMATLYIGRGKKEKLSKMDIVGFLCKKGGLRGADLGRIDVADHYAIAAVRRDKIKSVVQRVAGEKIKGMKTIYIIS